MGVGNVCAGARVGHLARGLLFLLVFNFLISIFRGRGLIKGFPKLLVMGPVTYLSELCLLLRG